jgi:hypothetical protein
MDFGTITNDTLTQDRIDAALREHERTRRPALQRSWIYYRNPQELTTTHTGSQVMRQGQEQGLPARLAANRRSGLPSRKELVIENDIAWRVQSMVDFMFGKPVRLRSTSADPAIRSTVEGALERLWERSGGIALLQDIALLGHVYGHVDLVLRVDADELRGRRGGRLDEGAHKTEPPSPAPPPAAGSLRIEVVEPTRGVAVLHPQDYRQILAYVISVDTGTRTTSTAPPRAAGRTLEVITPETRAVYENGELIDEEPLDWTGGQIPVVHIQNIAQPFRYEGLGEVEPLIPLQDELNTRLSDRASRVALQSFKMYLAKGLDGFENAPIGPGMVWSTDNMDASINSFGGDADSPSEAAHIQEVREAMDKVSGVPPLASGVVRARIGNLTSANALRITLMGVLAKTARKRVTYGRGLIEMSRLALQVLHDAGAIDVPPSERGLVLDWPDPLPVDVREEVAAARAKLDLGVPQERVLESLGEGTAGIN